uniref:Thioredoxin-like protein 4A n=1 Tax=Bos indicus x Bos taurus TaxID=30522 RepID=A0A4W2GNG9_BOBOX
MSYMLPHLHNGWQVDQAILSEEDRVVVIRFGHDWDPTCMKMDEVLYSIAEKVKNFAVIYLVDITEVPDFNKMYELYDPCTVMFFFRNKHIMIDLGTGNNNKINWAMEDKQEMIDIIETVYRGARKGRGLVVSPKDYSTKYFQLFKAFEKAFGKQHLLVGIFLGTSQCTQTTQSRVDAWRGGAQGTLGSTPGAHTWLHSPWASALPREEDGSVCCLTPAVLRSVTAFPGGPLL